MFKENTSDSPAFFIRCGMENLNCAIQSVLFCLVFQYSSFFSPKIYICNDNKSFFVYVSVKKERNFTTKKIFYNMHKRKNLLNY